MASTKRKHSAARQLKSRNRLSSRAEEAESTPKFGGLNRREVATFSGISVAAVDKAIEQKVLPRRRVENETLIEAEGVALMTILGHAQMELPVKAKQRVRTWVIDMKPHTKRSVQQFELTPVITVRCPPEARERARDANEYLRLRKKFIEFNPDIRGGLPVIRGTRIGVHAVATRVENGDTIAMLVEEYPDIPREAFEVAVRYAGAHPRRGRPMKPWRNKKGRRSKAE